jgi:hypothetical protein
MHGINEVEHDPIQFEMKVARMSAATCGSQQRERQ